MDVSDGLKARIKGMLVERLRLKVAPESIGDEESLFGGGLGLDSIDVLEVVAGLEKEFGVTVASQEEGERVLKSVDAIGRFLLEQGAVTN
jgi:acyl carrier protein